MGQAEKTKKKLKAPAAAIQVPQSREAVANSISTIGAAKRQLAVITAEMNDHMSRVKEHYEKLAAPHNEVVAALQKGVQIWCEAHRDELTDGGKVKTAVFISGEVKWRMNPKSVSVKAVKAVLKALADAGLSQFIRTKLEIDKEAILADPAAVESIKGITIEQGEEFVIEPFEVKLQEVA